MIKRTEYPNGLVLLSERYSGFLGFVASAWIRTGTRWENPKKAGISHFIEHMLFKGTESRTGYELVQEIEQYGGDFNAFTSREYTCFEIEVPYSHFERGIEILADVILHSVFENIEINKEREVIVEEIASYDDIPEELIFDLYSEEVYGSDHGLGIPILGTQKTLKNIRKRDLDDFYRREYIPSQTILACAGDVSHQKIAEAVRKKLGRGRWGRANRLIRPKEKSPEFKSGFKWIPRKTEQSHVLWGVEGFPFDSKYRFASLLLSTYLGSGMSSRLFQVVREELAIGYTVYSYPVPFLDSGMFTLYAAIKPDQISEYFDALDRELDRVCRKKLSQTKLKEIKSHIIGSIRLSQDDLESRLSSMTKNEMFFGRQISVETICKNIEKVTAEEIRSCALALFEDQDPFVMILGPQGSKRTAASIEKRFI